MKWTLIDTKRNQAENALWKIATARINSTFFSALTCVYNNLHAEVKRQAASAIINGQSIELAVLKIMRSACKCKIISLKIVSTMAITKFVGSVFIIWRVVAMTLKFAFERSLENGDTICKLKLGIKTKNAKQLIPVISMFRVIRDAVASVWLPCIAAWMSFSVDMVLNGMPSLS